MVEAIKTGAYRVGTPLALPKGWMFSNLEVETL